MHQAWPADSPLDKPSCPEQGCDSPINLAGMRGSACLSLPELPSSEFNSLRLGCVEALLAALALSRRTIAHMCAPAECPSAAT